MPKPSHGEPRHNHLETCGVCGLRKPVREMISCELVRSSIADELYDICIVLDWNVSCRKRNGGSAIFFHLIRPGYEPTAGCVALSRRDMWRILPH